MVHIGDKRIKVEFANACTAVRPRRCAGDAVREQHYLIVIAALVDKETSETGRREE